MTVVELVFRVQGTKLPVDHGYALYSTVSRTLGAALHEDNSIGLHPIHGLKVDQGPLHLHEMSRLRIRTPVEHIPDLLKLSGKSLEVDGYRIRLGVPQTYALVPVTTLVSRMVTIKGFEEPEAFLVSARRKLTGTRRDAPYHEMSLTRDIEILIPPRRTGPYAGQPTRRVLRIKDKTVVGFAVIVSGLTGEESLLLQKTGLGGRRHMGCGIFVPVREQESRP